MKVKLSLISHQQVQITSKSLHRTTPLGCEPQAEQESSNKTLTNKKTPNQSYKQRRHPTNKLATKTTGRHRTTAKGSRAWPSRASHKDKKNLAHEDYAPNTYHQIGRSNQ
jgi:hypothetical protein